MRKSLVLFFATLLALTSVAFAAPPGLGGPPPLVTVVRISEQDVNPPTEYVGHVEAIQYVDLRARVEGFLDQVNFKEGAYVRAGDLLYTIEQAPYRARLEAAQAQVADAKAVLQKASRHLKRLRAARPESVPATDMDNAVAEELQARARVEETKAELHLARINFGYTTIMAPISGRIGKTAYTRGNLVNLGSGPLGRIVQIDPIRVVYPVSEMDLPAIQAALRDASRGKRNSLTVSRLRLANGQVLKREGHIDFVDNQVDSATGTIAVWAIFSNSDRLLIPGQYVTVLVRKSRPRLMPVVPQAAVLVSRKGRYVLVVDSKDQAAIRPVTLGPTIGTYWAVKTGLKAGEEVIVQGIQKVRPGQKVRIKTVRPQGN